MTHARYSRTSRPRRLIRMMRAREIITMLLKQANAREMTRMIKEANAREMTRLLEEANLREMTTITEQANTREMMRMFKQANAREMMKMETTIPPEEAPARRSIPKAMSMVGRLRTVQKSNESWNEDKDTDDN